MFESFLDALRPTPDHQVAGGAWSPPALVAVEGYRELAAAWAGCTFAQGLYRLHDVDSGPRSAAHLAEAFPQYWGAAVPFGYDWLGRQFAVDARADPSADDPLVLLLEPGTGEALEIPVGFVEFHDVELVEQHDAALASSFFEAWAAGNSDQLPLPHDRCVGYRVPLFLGGADEIDNLEVVDLDVYWALSAQLIAGTQDLPPGTAIGEVRQG